MMALFERLFERVVVMTRDDQGALPLFAKVTKLGEEYGELCEAVLDTVYPMPASKKVGTVVEESADVTLMVMDILSRCYPDLSPRELMEMFVDELYVKAEKWERVHVKRDVQPK